MELRLDNLPSGHRFVSVSDRSVRIDNVRYSTSLVVTPNEIISNWSPQHLNELTATDLDVIMALRPELIIVGTGATLRFPSTIILKRVITSQIGIDFMDTRAACRTYNVLSAENRRIAVGIIIERPATVA